MHTDKYLFKTLFIIQLLAAFLVTMGHYTAGIGSYTTVTAWDTALNHLSRFGTVILAMITGFFTAHSFYGKQTKAIPFFRGKIIYIIIPFLIAGVLYHEVLNGNWPTTWRDFMNIAVGKTGGHLYFIFMLIQYYIFAYLFKSLLTRRSILYVIVLFFIIQYAFIDYNVYWRGMGVRFFLPTWLFTIYLGHLFYEYRKEILPFILKQRVLLYVMTAISIGGVLFFSMSDKLYTANHLRFVLLTAVLILTLIAWLLHIIKKVSLPFQKGLTFFIYLTHSYVIIEANKLLLRRWEWTWLMENRVLSFVYLCAIFSVSLTIALIISKLIQRLTTLPSASSRSGSSVSS